jgi:hypothetical protein
LPWRNVSPWKGSKADFWALLKVSHFDSKEPGQKWMKMAEGEVIDGSIVCFSRVIVVGTPKRIEQ